MSDTFTICFRIPSKLRAPLMKLAAANRRSINAEVVMAIEGHIAAHRGSTFVSGHSDDCPTRRAPKKESK